jgi:hypothetical protein
MWRNEKYLEKTETLFLKHCVALLFEILDYNCKPRLERDALS